MGDGLIPEPHKVVYEDDEVRVSLVNPAKYMDKDAIDLTEPSVVERAHWAHGPNPGLDGAVSITLTAHQWAGVLATIRMSMAFSVHPGLIKLMHDSIYSQLPFRKDADNDA